MLLYLTSLKLQRLFSSVLSVPEIRSSVKAIQTSSGSELAMNTALLVAHCSDFIYYLSDNLTFAAGYKFINLSDETINWLYVNQIAKSPTNS